MRTTALCTAIAVFVAACHATPPEPPGRTSADRSVAIGSAPKTTQAVSAEPARAASATPATEATPAEFRYPARSRIVAIGDIHGDLAAARRALKLAGAVDPEDEW